MFHWSVCPGVDRLAQQPVRQCDEQRVWQRLRVATCASHDACRAAARGSAHHGEAGAADICW